MSIHVCMLGLGLLNVRAGQWTPHEIERGTAVASCVGRGQSGGLSGYFIKVPQGLGEHFFRINPGIEIPGEFVYKLLGLLAGPGNRCGSSCQCVTASHHQK